MSQCATLSLFRFARWQDRVWVFTQMGFARLPLSRTPGIGFWKLCGSGTGEGFTPVPNTAVWAILATWDDAERARQQTATAPVFRRFARRATESFTVFLRPTASRGEWAGRAPFSPSEASGAGPLAALTRATIRPRRLLRFWARSPDISARIGEDPNVMFKIGVGEVPWLHQVTFSVWPDAQSMAAFARTGPHADAIRAVRAEGWFAEELYARFSVTGTRGTWGGIDPISLKEAA